MKDYESMSDFEINKAVADVRGFEWEEGVVMPNPPPEHPDGYRCITRKITQNKRHWKTFDPCSVASDAWPIIVDNEITLHMTKTKYADDAKFKPTEGYVAASSGEFESIYSSGKNALRCAMIVFLMMQDNT
jgi:hypothetical protein